MSPIAFLPTTLPCVPRVQKGKNASRVLSMTRMKQARISSMYYCRLVPGDIIELLFDHVARFAFRVRSSPSAPMAGWVPVTPTPTCRGLSCSAFNTHMPWGRGGRGTGDGRACLG